MRGYATTLSVDLTPSEESILASFNQSTRRKIRGIGKFPVAVRPIDALSLASRMEELMHETLSRTGGDDRPREWEVPIALSQAEPCLSRLVGLFHEELKGPASLLAFAWGCGHGDHAHYRSGASTRAVENSIPCAHALLWDLMRWAKGAGCRWFDLGGITAGHHGSDDRLGGISDFKRGFSKQLVEVGQEWVFEPSATRAALAQGLSAAGGWFPRVLCGLRSNLGLQVRSFAL
jgi:lipid II:glycine glycyltransferase (peptidoglycan interpeptide bridge formation enzyme)